MGYYIELIDSNFHIGREFFNDALTALKSMFTPEIMTCSFTINDRKEYYFMWVDTDAVLNSTTLGEALAEIRYDPRYDLDGNIIDVQFTGEKLGDENILFQALAPYVTSGSYLRFQGEDGYCWTWKFDGSEIIKCDESFDDYTS